MYSTGIARKQEAKTGTAYVYGARDFQKAFSRAPEQVMTHSEERYRAKTFLWESNEMATLYKELGLTKNWNGNKGPTLSAPTYEWTHQAAKFNGEMRKVRNLRRLSDMPIKIITGSRDVRAYTPFVSGHDSAGQPICETDLREHKKFCDSVNERKGSKVCTFVELEGALHEIYKEADHFRDQGLNLVVDFFLK